MWTGWSHDLRPPGNPGSSTSRPAYEQALRPWAKGRWVDLVNELEGGDEVERLAAVEVVDGSDTCGPSSRN